MLKNCLACAAAAFYLLIPYANAEDNRYALVIGNGMYEEGRLKNPANDAKLISQSLSDLGFQVETKTDLNQEAMEETISTFCRRLPKNSFAFFFFAGHGIQAKKANYLIPIGTTLTSESSLKYRTVALDFVRDELQNSKSSLNVVVLDCCRNNPFERSWNRSMGQRGLASVPDVPEGNVIAFATGDGKTAADGVGSNSPYTIELAAALSARPDEGLTLVEGVFFTLGRTLKPKTNQHPHLYVDSTMPKYYLWKPASADSSKKSEMQAALPKQPAITKPTPSTKPQVQPKASAPIEKNELLAQAFQYHNEGEFEYAIEAFSAVIMDPELPRSVREQARRGRGGAYLAQGTAESINRAIIDFKAAKERGIQLSVLTSEAQLLDGKKVTGKAHLGEVVLLTQSKGDWFWVDSVQSNPSRKGWIKCSALLSKKESSNNVAASSAQSVMQPSQSQSIANPVQTVKSQTTPAQPSSTASVGSISPSSTPMTSFGPDGKPIGVIPSRNGQTVASSQQSLQQPTTGQRIIYDQNGNPVYQQSSAPQSASRAVQTPQTQAYRIDQFGNRIPITQSQQSTVQRPNTSYPQNTVFYDQYGRPMANRTTTASGQRQVYNQPQMNRTQTVPQRQHVQNQRYSNQNFNNSSSSLKDLNSQRRDFDREVARYQRENGPLSAAERREVNQWRIQNDKAKARAFWGK